MNSGPSVTQYELEVQSGTKLKKDGSDITPDNKRRKRGLSLRKLVGP